MRDIASVDQESRPRRRRGNFVQRVLQCRGNVGIGGLVEPEMAVADRRELGTPAAAVQTTAVPAQVMHFRKPRRCISPGPMTESMLMDELLLIRFGALASAPGSTGSASGLVPLLPGIR